MAKGAAATTTPGGYIPYDAPLPHAANAQQGALIANTAYQKALAQLNQRRQSLLRQYGYMGDIDAKTGVISNVRVDAHNPYGSYQTLLRNSALAGERAKDEAEGRGLHGGLAHQLEREVQYQHGAESQQLGTSMADSLADFQAQQEEAAVQRDQALYQALLDAARGAVGDIAGGGGNPPDTHKPDDGNNDDGGGDEEDPYQKWLRSQSAAAGMYRTNNPRGIRGTYVQ